MDTERRDAITLAGDVLRHLFGAPFRLRTYTNLLYLLLAFPLGVAYFVFLVVGPDGRLRPDPRLDRHPPAGPGLRRELGVRGVRAPGRHPSARRRGAADVAAAASAGRRRGPPGSGPATSSRNPVTWKGMGFLLLKFPLGIVSFVATW